MEILMLMKQKAKKLFIDVLTILGLNKDNSMYYIGGAETLPAPLSADEENELLNKLANGDESIRKILVERNLRLVVYIAKKFENTNSGIEDLVSIGTIGLMKAINTFDVNKNIKLATYASRCIENEILMHLRKTSKLKNEVSIDEPLNVDGDGNELLLADVLGNDEDAVFKDIEDEVDRKLILDSINKLNKREKKIMELRFGFITGNEQTQKEVADLLGISQSYISRLEKKIIVRMRKDMKSKI
ncbi:MAG: RNA polymerase sporulation sigma factor SigE [Clostridia bacterium]|nr:RNA polymerase sporulation sigma factor SigE [Clostridia bacterium]